MQTLEQTYWKLDKGVNKRQSGGRGKEFSFIIIFLTIHGYSLLSDHRSSVALFTNLLLKFQHVKDVWLFCTMQDFLKKHCKLGNFYPKNFPKTVSEKNTIKYLKKTVKNPAAAVKKRNATKRSTNKSKTKVIFGKITKWSLAYVFENKGPVNHIKISKQLWRTNF